MCGVLLTQTVLHDISVRYVYDLCRNMLRTPYALAHPVRIDLNIYFLQVLYTKYIRLYIDQLPRLLWVKWFSFIRLFIQSLFIH